MERIFKHILLGAAALLSLFAVYILLGPLSAKVDLQKRLEAEGVSTQAKVTDKYIQEYLTYNNSSNGPRKPSLGRLIRNTKDLLHTEDGATVNYIYYVNVEFKTALGQAVRAKSEIPGEFYEDIATGAVVQVLYHPQNPAEINRLMDHSYPFRDFSDLFRIMAMVLLSIAAILAWWGWPSRGTKSRGAESRESNDGHTLALAAVDRIASQREARAPTSQSPARRIASAAPGGTPKGFGRTARTIQRR